MSTTVAVTSEGARSGLNPNAPLFIPTALQQVEDFSPEWYELVKTSTWFREHWLRKQQERDIFDVCEDEDVLNMLPDSFELGIDEEPSNFDGFEEAILQQANGHVGDCAPNDGQKNGAAMDVNSVMKTLNLKSAKNHGIKGLTDIARNRDKPIPTVSPKPSRRHVIQQPR